MTYLTFNADLKTIRTLGRLANDRSAIIRKQNFERDAESLDSLYDEAHYLFTYFSHLAYGTNINHDDPRHVDYVPAEIIARYN